MEVKSEGVSGVVSGWYICPTVPTILMGERCQLHQTRGGMREQAMN
jgi:hypothetical protein